MTKHFNNGYFANYSTVETIYSVQIICSIDDALLEEHLFKNKKDAVTLFNHLIQSDINAEFETKHVYKKPKFTFK
jgi:hypothetical protein